VWGFNTYCFITVISILNKKVVVTQTLPNFLFFFRGLGLIAKFYLIL
jgi:hypothetical protein